MSNAWFYYLFPLTIGMAFTIAGSIILRHVARGDRTSRRKKYSQKDALMALLFVIIGSILCFGILFTSPTPWKRQRIFDHVFRTPPELIQRFVIFPGDDKQYRPLTTSEVVIDNPETIRQMADLLRGEQDESPNHPKTRWSARMELDTRDGTYFFGVTATEKGDLNGTLVNPSATATVGGWNLGDARVNGLDELIEQAVAAAKKR